VLVDLHTKWPEVAVCGTVTSTSVTNFLTDLFCRHGLPDNLISDNGPQFCSAEFENFLSSLGVHHSKTAVYNPSANGAVERFNKVLKEGLSVACAESASFLPSVKRILANYRSLLTLWCPNWLN
jgi:transposase InsO family protein